MGTGFATTSAASQLSRYGRDTATTGAAARRAAVLSPPLRPRGRDSGRTPPTTGHREYPRGRRAIELRHFSGVLGGSRALTESRSCHGCRGARCPIWGHVSAGAGRAARDANGNWSLPRRPRGRILPTHYERTVAAGARSATGIIPAKCALPHQRAFRSAEILPQRTTGTTPTSTSPTSPSLQNSVATVRGDAVEGSDVDLVVESSCPLGKGYDLTGLAG